MNGQTQTQIQTLQGNSTHSPPRDRINQAANAASPDPQANGQVPEVKLPDPAAPPPKTNKPEEYDLFIKRNPTKDEEKARDAQEQAYQDYQAYLGEKEVLEVLAASEGRSEIEESFTDGQNFTSQYEAIDSLVDTLKEVYTIDLEMATRTKAYLRLRTLALKFSLERMYDVNAEKLDAWARNGFKEGEVPKVHYVRYEDQEGQEGAKKEIITVEKPKVQKDDPWRNINNKEEDAPEQTPIEPLQGDFAASIEAAWAEGDEYLINIIRKPEEIRGQPGEQIKRVNTSIKEQMNTHTRETVQTRIPDLTIPVGQIMLLILESVEYSIRENTESLKDVTEARNLFASISAYAERMNQSVPSAAQPRKWVGAIEEACKHYIQLKKDNGVNTIEAMHTSPLFWGADLRPYVLDNVMASGQRTTEIPEHFKIEVDEVPPAPESASGTQAGQASGSQDASTGRTAQASQPQAASAGQAGQGPESQTAPAGQAGQGSPPQNAVQDWVSTGYIPVDNVQRRVRGIHKQGFCERILLERTLDSPGNGVKLIDILPYSWYGTDDAKERYLGKNGYIPSFEAVARAIFPRRDSSGQERTSSEVNKMLVAQLKAARMENFVVTAIAIYQEGAGMKLIEGHVPGSTHFLQPRFYTFSGLKQAWGKRWERNYDTLMAGVPFQGPLRGSPQNREGPAEKNDGVYADEGDLFVAPGGAHMSDVYDSVPVHQGEAPTQQAPLGTDDIVKKVTEQVEAQMARKFDEYEKGLQSVATKSDMQFATLMQAIQNLSLPAKVGQSS